MKLTKDIQDEKEGEERYKFLAKKDKRDRGTLLSMSRDERRHRKNLLAIKSKNKAIKSKMKK